VADSVLPSIVERQDTPTEPESLFGELAAGHSGALDGLYRLFAGDVYGLALWRTGSTEDAADVLQEVFVRLAQRAPRLGRVRDPKAFVLTLAHRAAVDSLRRRKRKAEFPLSDVEFVAVSGEDPDRRLDARRVSSHLRSLPDKQRAVVYLHVYADCTFAEAARIMGIPTFTAASRFRLAVERLRKLSGVRP
jgi:RNA polymerase sigma-70 factor (ECF subfamily)